MKKTLALLAALGLVASPALAIDAAKVEGKAEVKAEEVKADAKVEGAAAVEAAPAAGGKVVKKEEGKVEEKK